jgi:streptogramin lyase
MDINGDGDVVAIDQTEEVLLRCGGRWSKLSTVPAPLRDVDFVRFRTNGDLWAGSEKGLFLYKHRSLRWEYKRNDFPNRNRIHEIIQSIDGSLWLATADGLEIHYPNGKVKIITHIGGKPLYEITGIAEDPHGHIWISSGSAFDGTYRWDGDRWEYYRVDENIKWLKFHKIRKDRHGKLWFLGLSKNTGIDGTDAPGAYECVNDAFTRWSTKDGLVSGRVYSFGESSDGALWFGTNSALSKWKNGNWRHWYLRADIPFVRIFTLAIDNDDNVWFSDNHNGLGSIDKKGNLKIITTSDGLLNNNIWDLAVDSGGRLWMTTEGGVSSLEQGKWKNFDAKSGLLTNDLWPILPVGDSVYVGTKGKGLAILDLRRSLSPTPKIFYNKPVIEENKAFIRIFPFEYGGDLQPSSISVRYSVNNASWSNWDTKHDIVLTNLEPDDYSVNIQAQNLFGEFNPEGTIVNFTISHPFYRQPIFFLPIGSLFLIMILILVEYISHKKNTIERFKSVKLNFAIWLNQLLKE